MFSRDISYAIKVWQESDKPIKVLIKFTSKLYSFSGAKGPKNREDPLNEYA